MKRALLIGAAALLVLCCAGGTAVVALRDRGDAYAAAPDPCDLPEVSRFGKVHQRRAEADGCVVEVGDRVVTVVATVRDARSRYDAARRGARDPQPAEGEWDAAYVTDLVVAFLDDNLFLSLRTDRPGDVRAILLQLARDLLRRLREDRAHHHRDLFGD